MAGKSKRHKRKKRDETWNFLDEGSRSPERNWTTLPFRVDKAVVGYCCPDFLQGGVAVFFYVMTICTPVTVLILVAGQRQSKCGSTPVL